MRYASLIIALSAVLFGCSRRDSQLQKDVVGSWIRDSGFKMTVSPDGSFVSHWETTNTSVTFQGTWQIRGGRMISTTTNCVAEGFANVEPVGSVNSYEIIRVDSRGLVYSINDQIITFRRE